MQEYQSIWKHLFRIPYKLAWVDVKGVPTRYLEAGDANAPTVLFLHGASGSLELFCANIAAFAQHFHVLALDMMGSGWTGRPDYPYTPEVYRDHARDFMDVLGVKRASFVGVAVGSAIAVHVAHAFPERVDRIVMVAPGGIVSDPAELERFVSGVKERRGAAVEALTWNNVRKIVSALVLDEERVMDDMIAARMAFYSDGDLERNMRNALAAAGPQLCLSHDQWQRLRVPLLVIAAVDASNMFLRNARLIGELAPCARVVDMPGCRVWAHFEQAERFNEISISFLSGSSST